jgi:opacity protein-like surface antigen
MRYPCSAAIALVSATVFFSCPANAQSSGESDSDWEVGVSAYFWASGMKGNVRAVEGTEPAKVDLSFGDIFNSLKFAGMGTLQARHDRFVMTADIGYVSLGASKGLTIRDTDLAEGELDTSTLTASALAGYRIVDNSPVTLDLMAGARLNSVSMDIELTGPLRSVEADVKETWIDPVVGAHLSVPLAPHWSVAFYGDVGGFGVSSDFTWQMLGAIQYDISDRWRASAGWRHYAVDYHKGDFLYDVSFSGPIVGIRHSF